MSSMPPQPPPMPGPPDFTPRLRQSRQAAAVFSADLSQVDGRTVAAISLLASGFAGLVAFTPICPIACAPAFVFAVFSKPSFLRTTAVLGSLVLLGLYVAWIVFSAASVERSPLIRDFGL